MKSKVLFILHVPPPVNGAAIMGQYIKNSEKINQTFEATYINLTSSFSLDKIGKGGINKVLAILNILLITFISQIGKKYDLCYVTLSAKGAGFYKDVLVVFILKVFRRKIVYHFHNKGVKDFSEKKINKFLYRFVFKNTKSILLSEKLYYDIEQYVNKKDVYFCANGIHRIPLGEITTTNKSSFNEGNKCRLLFLSNMMLEKGVLELLKACELLKNKGLIFECHFVGAWSDISKDYFYQIIAEYDISNYVFAHGKKYNNDKLEFFMNTDIFVFPTYYHNETFGLVILEAMQANLPVVSTFEGGIPDVVIDGETGILVQQKNSQMLADKLEILINNPELRKKMGDAGRKRFLELFQLKFFENSLLNILEDIIKCD